MPVSVWRTRSVQQGLSIASPGEVVSIRLFITTLAAFLLSYRYSLYFLSLQFASILEIFKHVLDGDYLTRHYSFSVTCHYHHSFVH